MMTRGTVEKTGKKEPSSKEGFAFRIGSGKNLKLPRVVEVSPLLSTAAAPSGVRDLLAAIVHLGGRVAFHNVAHHTVAEEEGARSRSGG